MIRRLHHPAVYALVGIVAMEAMLSVAFRGLTARAFDERRNPFARRNWDEYTRLTSRPRGAERRVLVLGNSQARGPEYPSDRIYSSLVQKDLAARGGPVPTRVVNWSFGPNRVPEAILLLARARELDPDVLLAVFPPNWFAAEDYENAGEPTPLSFFPSDLADTAWLFRDLLPPEFVAHYVRPIRAVDALAVRALPTWRYRDLPISALARRRPWVQDMMPVAERAAWYAVGTSAPRRVQQRVSFDLSGSWPHPALLRMFLEAAAPLRARKVFVLQPHYYQVQRGREVIDALRQDLRRAGWAVWDLSEVVDPAGFFEESVHLAEEGHVALGAVLAEGVASVMTTPAPGRSERP